ncbi:SpoIID/LytB domain-containing protein [Anthocerotibacter panamensis]|uniref:SpoIID/LytB domain-containing protein n=1 Tax=Anthocerotibacter panamensis TaxID=2857077 RepID=UPI001C402C31|nr:SpoIID/LytB domain-containing protein [Anthocerotibacter panamensis]
MGVLRSRSWLWVWVLWLGFAPVQAKTLEIGIFQRFGEHQDEATIQSTGPLKITLDQNQTLSAPTVAIQTARIPLAQPIPWSRVVVSAHRSFEDAQVVADGLKPWNIEPLLARPQRWQVWALRRSSPPTVDQEALVGRLHTAGYSTARLESGLQTDEMLLDLTIDGTHYQTREVTIQAPQNRLQFGARRYGGTLRLSPNAYGTYSVINRIDLETYLRGVVPYEIAPKAPYEAIKAQAIVARTFALKNLNRFRLDGYDLCATANCQVYQGLGGVTPLTDRAVQTTRQQVLTYQGKLVDALYTSANGGLSARYSDLWGGEDRPYLRPRLDRIQPLSLIGLSQEQGLQRFFQNRTNFNETGSPAFRWTRTYSAASLLASLTKNLPTLGLFVPLKAVTGLRVLERSDSGRVLRLGIQTDQGEITLSKDSILSAIERLPSTLFYIELEAAGSFRLIGGGWGHGLGLSQYGSYGLARRGWDYRRILNFYFPATRLMQHG